jgi:hypothetical protein
VGRETGVAIKVQVEEVGGQLVVRTFYFHHEDHKQ